MTPAAIEEMIDQRVTAALEAREVNRNLGIENENGNGGGDGNGDGNNGGDNGNGNGNRNVNGRGDMPIARECTYQDFMKCQPLNFKGTEGVVGLIRWCEKMETVFHISNCPERYQVKYATCTLLGIVGLSETSEEVVLLLQRVLSRFLYEFLYSAFLLRFGDGVQRNGFARHLFEIFNFNWDVGIFSILGTYLLFSM
ncbi:hypothetical protein Tco_0961454 [Tanacetum coccineum]